MEAQVLTPLSWDQSRWLGILERVEYRREDIGLRFWGPPLWLEVTMTGPDSDAWFSAGASAMADQSWDWQSTEPCAEAMELADAGADDERLLDAASRYTVENLILNATHEIGEWLRFDAQRLFAAHGPQSASGLGAGQPPDGVQGNGSVRVDVSFGLSAGLVGDVGGAPSGSALDQLAERLGDLAAAWRFSYLPGKMISYGRTGPAVTDSTGPAVTESTGPAVTESTSPADTQSVDGPPTNRSTRWTSPWSCETLRLVAAPANEFVAAVQRDVHRMLVRYETRRICDEFYVDAAQIWRSEEAPDCAANSILPDQTARPDGRSVGMERPDKRGVVSVRVSYDR
jgi:hypothetical protein